MLWQQMNRMNLEWTMKEKKKESYETDTCHCGCGVGAFEIQTALIRGKEV